MRVTIAGIAAAFAFVGAAFADPTTPEGWRAAAAQDLDAIKAHVVNDTPIGAGVADASYTSWLNQGYAQAQARLPQVSTQGGYYYLLAGYVNGFHDPHLSLAANTQTAPRWPGFIATRQRDAIVVAWRDPADNSAPPLGARITSCDGDSMDTLAQRTVFDFAMNPGLPESKRRAAPRLFLDLGNPFAPSPRACVFETSAGARTIALNWRDLPNPATAFNAAFADAGLGPAAPLSFETMAPGVAWIGAPTFSPDFQTGQQMIAVMGDITRNAATMRAGRAIVIDLRGNVGGSTDWAQQLARAVFGADVLARVPLANPGGAALWRASEGNLAYWRDYFAQMQRPGSLIITARTGAYSRELTDGMQRALNKHEPIWRQGSRSDPAGGGITQRRPHDGAPPFPARVYVLSNGSCVSSCLDFLDVVLQIPGVQLIGAPSSADGVLADVRTGALPSGAARFTFAQKLMLGRGRASMEYYTPDVAYDGPWTDVATRAWVMSVIAAH